MFYSEGSSFSGFEVEDNISVGGEDNNDQAFPLRFGCQTDITGLFESQIPDGIFGMNKNKGSAIMQWNNTGYLDAAAFSLCYNVRQDVNKQSGVMVLGGPDERLHETTMKFAKDVGIENYELRIKDVHLKRGSALSSSAAKNTTVNLGLAGDNTATLDSGTTCTYLNREWKDSLEDAWRQVTDGKYSMFSHLSITDAELNELPTIVFDLESTTNADESITVDYPPIRYMEKSDYGGWDFCLYASDSAATVTLGNTFMAGHDVLHDLENKRIGFAESKCEVKTIADPPGISVESDADIATPSHSNMTLLKSVVLEPEPIHKRKKDAKTPVLDTFYALLAVAFVAVVALVLYSRYRRKDMREDENIGDDFEPTVAELT